MDARGTSSVYPHLGIMQPILLRDGLLGYATRLISTKHRRSHKRAGMSISILGISAYCHDSAGALLRDGEIVGAAQEERFTRKKHDARFPARAACWCLADAGLRLAQIDAVVCHDSGVSQAG